MDDKEFMAISQYMLSLRSYERWKGLSPLASRLKSAFLSHLTGAAGDAVQSCSGKRKRVGEDDDFQDQNQSQYKRRAETHSSNEQEFGKDAASSQGYSQPPIPVSHPHMISNMADGLQVLAEVATTTGPVSNGIY